MCWIFSWLAEWGENVNINGIVTVRWAIEGISGAGEYGTVLNCMIYPVPVYESEIYLKRIIWKKTRWKNNGDHVVLVSSINVVKINGHSDFVISMIFSFTFFLRYENRHHWFKATWKLVCFRNVYSPTVSSELSDVSVLARCAYLPRLPVLNLWVIIHKWVIWLFRGG